MAKLQIVGEYGVLLPGYLQVANKIIDNATQLCKLVWTFPAACWQKTQAEKLKMQDHQSKMC